MTTSGPDDDVEGPGCSDEAPPSGGLDRSLAPQPDRAEASAPHDEAGGSPPEQSRQSQQ